MAGRLVRAFGELLEEPLRNGLNRPKKVRGQGVKMVNMGELFAHDRIGDVAMEYVPLPDAEAERFLLRSGDLLFARQSLVLDGAGKCSIFLGASEPVTYEGHIIRARIDTTICDPLFYYYFFQSPKGRASIVSIVEQVAAAGIRGSDLARLSVPYPKISEQRAIAHILGTLDDKIELNWRMNETLEAMTRALFKSWFVDFDPVRAKMRGEQPTGLAPEIAALFPDALVESELGEAPRGWDVIGLNEIATFLNGLALQKYPPEHGDSLPVIKISQLRKGNTEGADRASADLAEAYIIEDGDVLFSWSGSLECVIWTGGRGALNQHLFKVTSDRFPKWFYYLWIHQHLSWFQTIAAGKATTMGHIQRHHLAEAKVSVPPSTILVHADQVLGPMIDALVSRALESRMLTALRDTLLPKLISGELRVADAERIVEGSL